MFHDGEQAVQRRAGVERVAAQVGRNIADRMSREHAGLLRRQPLVVLASRDDAGRLWASMLTGDVGFARAVDEHHVLLGAAPAPGDPLALALAAGPVKMGLLAIEFDTRTRIRLNGLGRQTPDGILLEIDEAFHNCPKFIQRRIPTGRLTLPPSRAHASREARAPRKAATLSPSQAALVAAADTFFIASAHPDRGADASHRGGRPGFVEVSPDGTELIFPDYSGNRMFQTLGNLTSDPRTGLLFLDWEKRSSLLLTGRAEIVWDADEVSSRPGAERLVRVAVDAVIERANALPARWSLIEPSRLNPPTRRRAFPDSGGRRDRRPFPNLKT
jgi:predicted pyridoxine 5'-phosphate oxidase superfamily flavin-nucleotide-binding protein